MAEYIDRDGFIEDIQTEIINLSMDGMKGTRMAHDELYGFIDRIKEQPASDVAPVARKWIWRGDLMIVVDFFDLLSAVLGAIFFS